MASIATELIETKRDERGRQMRSAEERESLLCDTRKNKRQSTLKDFHNTMARHQHREAWRLIKT